MEPGTLYFSAFLYICLTIQSSGSSPVSLYCNTTTNCSCPNGEGFSIEDCKGKVACTQHSKDRCDGTNDPCPPYYNPTYRIGPPNVTSNQRNLDKNADDSNVHILCFVLSNPVATVRWLFNSQNIADNPKLKNRYNTRNRINCQPTLTITSILIPGDTGNFTCLAENAKGSSNLTIGLRVAKKVLPATFSINSFQLEVGGTKVYLGSSCNLTCTANFPIKNSIYMVYFKRHRKLVRDDERHINQLLTSVGSIVTKKLWIKNVSLSDGRYWTCRASKNGIISDKVMYLEIVPCPAGYYCPFYENKKHKCEYGTYSDGKTNITHECTPCALSPETKPLDRTLYTSIEDCPSKAPPKGTKLMIYIYTGCGIVAFSSLCLLGWRKFRRKQRSLVNTDSGTELIRENNHEQIHCGREARDCSEATVDPHANNQVTEELRQEQSQNVYDIFFCYSNMDSAIVNEIITELEKQHFKCLIHIRDFVAGETIVKNITNAIYNSRITLAILSPNFLNSDFCNSELQQALARSMKEQRVRVIPILYKNCQIPNELQHKTYIDYASQYFWTQLYGAIGGGTAHT